MKCVICFFFFFFVKKIHWTFLKIYFWRPQIFSMLKMSSFVMAGSLSAKVRESARKNKITAQYFVDNYSFFDESSCLTLLIGLLKIFILFPLFYYSVYTINCWSSGLATSTWTYWAAKSLLGLIAALLLPPRPLPLPVL